jgi:hypothetical protein
MRISGSIGWLVMMSACVAFTSSSVASASDCETDRDHVAPVFHDADFKDVNAAFQAVMHRAGTIETLYRALADVSARMNDVQEGRGKPDEEAKHAAPVNEVKRFLDAGCIAEGTVLRVTPDLKELLALSQAQGTAADVAFFKLLARTNDGFGLRVYQQTCTDFSPKLLLPLYREWTAFQTANPRAYVADVKHEVTGLEEIFAKETCSCGDTAQAEALFSGFLQEFPNSAPAPAVKRRLKAVQEKRSDITFDCTPS